jgi:hypothetical protein
MTVRRNFISFPIDFSASRLFGGIELLKSVIVSRSLPMCQDPGDQGYFPFSSPDVSSLG